MTRANENLADDRNPLNSVNDYTDNSNGMAVVPKLTDPFDFHVYIGFSSENYGIVQRLIDTLKTALNLLCCHRQVADTTNEGGEGKHLIERSEKCLFYVTPEYLQETWAKDEVTAADVMKARRFSRGMLFVLKDPRISAESLKDLDLQEYPASDWLLAPDDDTLPKQLVSWLLQGVEIANIPQMPENMSGHCEALAYYFGYLNLVLDDHQQKMKYVVESGAKVVLPMLIVVPESCRAPKSFDVEGKIITSTDKYIMHPCHRGGRRNRDFKRSVMKLIIGAEENDVVYFSGEFPAILLTLYETYTSGQAGPTKDHLDRIRKDFYSTLQSLLCHPDNKHCVDQYRLVLWPDESEDLYEFLLPVVREFSAEEGNASSLVCGPPGRGKQLLDSSFNRLESSNNNLTRLWDGPGSQQYTMRDVRPRGIAVIIICDPTPTSIMDVSLLRGLFSEQFHFEVRELQPSASDQLDSLLCQVALEDHSGYDAFICYIACRGRMGTVRTSDGKCTSMINLVYTFNDKNSEKLWGKPKLFLIQTTDDGTDCDNDDTQVGRHI